MGLSQCLAASGNRGEQRELVKGPIRKKLAFLKKKIDEAESWVGRKTAVSPHPPPRSAAFMSGNKFKDELREICRVTEYSRTAK